MLTLQEYQDAANKTDITAGVIAKYLQPIESALGDLVREHPGYKDTIERLNELKHRMLLWYNVLGMVGEAGELANKIKKVLRDGKYDPMDLAKENGDILWYVTRFAEVTAFSLGQVASLNIQKLNERKEKGTLHGEGDNR